MDSSGASDDERAHIARLLDSFVCLPIDEVIADRAARIRREARLRLPDAFQAALAVTRNLELITRNTRDFDSRFDYVAVPYTL